MTLNLSFSPLGVANATLTQQNRILITVRFLTQNILYNFGDKVTVNSH